VLGSGRLVDKLLSCHTLMCDPLCRVHCSQARGLVVQGDCLGVRCHQGQIVCFHIRVMFMDSGLHAELCKHTIAFPATSRPY
jgi:hypothetical protein